MRGRRTGRHLTVESTRHPVLLSTAARVPSRRPAHLVISAALPCVVRGRDGLARDRPERVRDW